METGNGSVEMCCDPGDERVRGQRWGTPGAVDKVKGQKGTIGSRQQPKGAGSRASSKGGGRKGRKSWHPLRRGRDRGWAETEEGIEEAQAGWRKCSAARNAQPAAGTVAWGRSYCFR